MEKKYFIVLIILVLFSAQMVFAGLVRRTGSQYYQVIGPITSRSINTRMTMRTINLNDPQLTRNEPPLITPHRSSYWKCETRFDLRSPRARAWHEVNRKFMFNEIVTQNKCDNGCNQITGRCYSSPKTVQKCRSAFFGCTEFKMNANTGVSLRGTSKYYLGKKCDYSTGNCEKR